METIGMIGGTSWESTLEYYRLINEETRERLGGLHSARALLTSLDFAPVAEWMRKGDWDSVAGELLAAAEGLERGGADFLILCSNTMHRCADQVEESVGLPLVHICEPTGREAQRRSLGRVGLLGTRFVMEEGFLKRALEERFGLEVLVPEAGSRQEINRIIFEELCLGIFREGSRAFVRGCLEALRERGADGAVLGCTEIPMLITEKDAGLPLLDTTALHARAAVAKALEP